MASPGGRSDLLSRQKSPALSTSGGAAPAPASEAVSTTQSLRSASKARCIRQDDLVPRQAEGHLDDVPGGPGGRGDNRSLPPGEGVEERALPGIRGTHQGDGEPVPDLLCPPDPGHSLRQGCDQTIQDWPRPARKVLGQVLVGKIHSGLEEGQGLDKVSAPHVPGPAQGAVELGQGLAPLGLGLGINEVSDPLGLGQIEPAILEGAAGELAGLRKAQAKGRKGLQN